MVQPSTVYMHRAELCCGNVESAIYTRPGLTKSVTLRDLGVLEQQNILSRPVAHTRGDYSHCGKMFKGSWSLFACSASPRLQVLGGSVCITSSVQQTNSSGIVVIGAVYCRGGQRD